MKPTTKRPRPYIPLPIQLEVAKRQYVERPTTFPKSTAAIAETTTSFGSLSDQLSSFLTMLFDDQPTHLDHDPPLRSRTFNEKTGRYTPDANDPRFLIWRTVDDHRRKTYLRGDGAQFSDTVLIKRERRRERRQTPPPNTRIAKTWNLHPCMTCGRVHTKGKCPNKSKRKLASRPFQKRKKR